MYPDILFKAVSEILKIPAEQMLARNSQYLNVMARTMVIVYLYNWDYTFKQIAEILQMNNSTVIHHCRKYSNEYKHNLLFRFISDNILKYLKFEHYNTIEDLTAIIDYLIKNSQYLEYKTEGQSKLIISVIYKRCGYSTINGLKSGLELNRLTANDEKFIDDIHNQVKEWIDAQGLSN